MLSTDERVEQFLVAFTACTVTATTAFPVQSLRFFQVLPLANVRIRIHRECLEVSGNIGDSLWPAHYRFPGNRVHLGIVAIARPDIGKLLDYHAAVLAGELRKIAAVSTPGILTVTLGTKFAKDNPTLFNIGWQAHRL